MAKLFFQSLIYCSQQSVRVSIYPQSLILARLLNYFLNLLFRQCIQRIERLGVDYPRDIFQVRLGQQREVYFPKALYLLLEGFSPRISIDLKYRKLRKILRLYTSFLPVFRYRLQSFRVRRQPIYRFPEIEGSFPFKGSYLLLFSYPKVLPIVSVTSPLVPLPASLSRLCNPYIIRVLERFRLLPQFSPRNVVFYDPLKSRLDTFQEHFNVVLSLY